MRGHLAVALDVAVSSPPEGIDALNLAAGQPCPGAAGRYFYRTG
ncbi:hypothetical protein [Haematobacter genomosp. 1]|nr:hypothetical protein [Haematobacter genomosp. 1]